MMISILIIISAIIHIRAEYTNTLLQIFIFKPFTTSLIILLCFLRAPEISLLYHYLILAGLFCSLTGDIFLMLPSDKFIQGLFSFLCAHILYIVAFSSEHGFQIHLIYLAPIIVLGGVLLRILLPHTAKMSIPVIFYTLVILIMLWQAIERWGTAQSQSAVLAGIGALLFVCSDATLAYDRFVKHFHLARFLVLTTYYCAQWCIAYSV